jgi:hypothetical protein
MTEHYAKNYRTLGIQPGVSWKQLRQTYKKLVNTWHPDRFQQLSHQKKLAEEKTKEITQSYKELAEYYKEFGALPLVGMAAEITSAEKNSSQRVYNASPGRENLSTEPAVNIDVLAQAQKRHPSPLTRILVAVALTSIAYFVWNFMPWEIEANRPTSEKPTAQATNKKQNEGPTLRVSDNEKYFSFGMSPGEVYAIQGIPTRTEHDVWYYGSSRVYFAKGKVQRWEESPDNPLRVNINPGTEKIGAKFFSKGSSKKEVLAVQGVPGRDTGDVWDYGASRIYFDNDRVKGWDESPLDPLKLQR